MDIPQYVIEALAEARETGEYNMFSRSEVIRLILNEIDADAAMWLNDNKDRYMDALNAMGEWISQS